jgi:AhpD family alkylhydroperoxidase
MSHAPPLRRLSSESYTTIMKSRLNHLAAAPEAIAAMRSVEAYVRSCGLEHSLLELVKTRASQINGCAFCIDMHTRDARAQGETEQRLYLLSAWQEAPVYSDRERAALAWTEALTRIADTHAPDDVYEHVRQHFTEEELVKLTLAIGTINVWNRLAIGFRALPPTTTSNARAIAHA